MSIATAKANYVEARRTLASAVKEEIAEGLLEAFGDPSVENVVFGVSTQAYNDENAGIGTYGPLVNSLSDEDDFFNRDDEYSLFYDYSSRVSGDRRVKRLADALESAGWEFAAEALGVSYSPGESYGGQEMAFVAQRRSDGSYSLYEHSVGY